ncbi:hypothetical protein BpHYR1_001321 [Brachionus plicatilis]|uniref:Uncharacterized protein n=1 Tax=Brachionus plicatilis TaxID=10195 RepID=A0A3M7T7G3_BRAPC|nr:hypothetical protein BpHYR1_001321 [Brachionus plicatilis]
MRMALSKRKLLTTKLSSWTNVKSQLRSDFRVGTLRRNKCKIKHVKIWVLTYLPLSKEWLGCQNNRQKQKEKG